MWDWFLFDHGSWRKAHLSKAHFSQSKLWQLKQKGSLLVYLKFLLLKFLIACFYRTFSRPWLLLKKVSQWISKDIDLTTFVWSFFIRVHFVFALQYLCYCNEYPMKQTASLYLKLPLKPAFLFFLFLES